MRRALALGLLSLLLALPALATEAAPEMASRLAPSVLRGASEVPELWLAQRSIDREWGPSEDSLYQTVEIPAWKNEGLALALSAAVPGTGQLYVGERSGWIYLLVEALGWAGRTITRQRGDELAAEAAGFVGDPTQPSSGWSFERYAQATGRDAQELRVLWDQDRDAFYELLSRNDDYRFGFAGSDPLTSYDTYRSVHESSQDRYQRSRYSETVLWVNHVVAAFDALRAARNHNMPLRRDLELRLGGRLRGPRSEVRAVLVRRF